MNRSSVSAVVLIVLLILPFLGFVSIQNAAFGCGETWEEMILGGRKVTALERDFLQFMIQHIDTTCPAIRGKVYATALDRTGALVKAWDNMATKYRRNSPKWYPDPAKWTSSIDQARASFAKMQEFIRLHQLVKGHYNYLQGKSHIMSLFSKKNPFTAEYMLDDMSDLMRTISKGFVRDKREEVVIRLLSCQSKIEYLRAALLKKHSPRTVNRLLAKLTEIGARLNAIQNPLEQRQQLSSTFREYIIEFYRVRAKARLLPLTSVLSPQMP
ncbi:MAG: hypothetical protein CVV64_15910 [Candidatus Wallbacteria bacterium HGW-Wallbacteria-1]|jgi:hypothetical protein|uniref:Uncharacterized protein n=1 Tax=Candidatus Wallbacteria bacterium HGW-Wallbacteria-1 TaxID=2013854 RepID=A0A2N1PLA9_9BACT|nr:MAG: hypothetical protein CVV64_15910 [Candidatus Wallbacteria bacterium HGW-Wallbacteria-1]